MANNVEEAVVRKSVRVQAPIAHAFSVFVEQMESWWPASHHIGDVPFEAIFVEPRAGGRWYERNAEGNLKDWGTVLEWNPPHAVKLSWHFGPGHDQPDWVCDPDVARASELEIRFTEEGANTTLVELEHSKLERHGGDAQRLRVLFDGPGAWSQILESYAQCAQNRSER